ncbi:MAG: sulfatase [Planctomycetota bacterium]|nr:MAG: sulfatase [Planctomycetota bacterium]
MRPRLLVVLSLLPFVPGPTGCGATGPAAVGRPNFLFLLADDLGWTDLGCTGSTFYDTPALDQLAAGGTRFTQAYAACPVCSPTRASILTGKYPARLATTDYFGAPQPEQWRRDTPLLPAPYHDRLPHGETTLAEALHEAGYATFFAGKWHLGPEGWWPEDQGFDVNRGGITRGGPYGGNKYFSPYGNPRLTDGPEGEHLPARLAAETVAFIRAHRDRPFLAYLSFYSVHTPLMGRPDLVAKYEQRRRQRGLEPRWGREGGRRVRLVQEHAVYAAMVEAMDAACGVVLDALEEFGLAERTVVFFFSDNGGLSTSEGHPTSNLPLRAGKGWLYEGGIREPLIVRWPGRVAAGAVCDQPVISTDFYPTILELAGLPARPGQHLDGLSLAPLLLGRSGLPARPLFWHYPHYGNQGGRPGGAVRLGRWKLIEWFGEERPELYDLDRDLGEAHDLAAERPEQTAELAALLRAWRRRVAARMPAPNPAWSGRR